MVSAALLAAIAVGCFVAAARLRRASWPYRGPYEAVIAWQALGLAWGVSTIGALLAFGLSVYGQGVFGGLFALVEDASAHGLYLTGAAESPLAPVQVAAILVAIGLTLVLFCGLTASFVQVVRTRRRHHDLLELVGRDDPGVPGARILDHPAAAAYCLPGVLRSEVVISAGALKVLDERELAAVIAHEHAHLRQRHDLVLLPFSSLKRAFPRVRLMEGYYRTVALLIEMCADDQARRERSPKELATALMRFGANNAHTPIGALAATSEQTEVLARVQRLLTPGRALTRAQSAAVLCGAGLLMAVTLLLWHVPV
ncbi:M56 family metallopeptidase [Nocardiopsis composta]|uniref:Zn-dependent protease with chaperone function n=1 Tax=Nocardiopsis composta TaxID=157465 RepID=A0A7W8QQ27_9ACTN|nr:M56 family metallopeptidase [Nocardiopsis composta]MBB5434114.1 Zn-dependent protease with chaperone function [Nocardiopsis composta]